MSDFTKEEFERYLAEYERALADYRKLRIAAEKLGGIKSKDHDDPQKHDRSGDCNA